MRTGMDPGVDMVPDTVRTLTRDNDGSGRYFGVGLTVRDRTPNVGVAVGLRLRAGFVD